MDSVSDDFAVKCFRGGLTVGSILKIKFTSKEPEDRNEMFNRSKRNAIAEAPKTKAEKKQKG